MNVTRISMFSGKTQTLDLPVTQAELAAYASGALIQNAFPHLPPSLREFVKTGVTPEEWDREFGKGSCARNNAAWEKARAAEETA
jgi:hypothetical protein